MNAAPKLSHAVALSAVLAHVEAGWPAAPDAARYKLANAIAHRSNGCPVSIAIALYVIDQAAIGTRVGVWPGADDLYNAAGLVHSALDFAWSGLPALALVGLGITLRTGTSGALPAWDEMSGVAS